jgi:hypothetical protein
MTDLSRLPWKSHAPAVTLRHDEKLLDHFSTHWVKYVPPVFLWLALQAGGIWALWLAYGNSAFGSLVAGILIMGFLTFVHHWSFHRILGYSLDSVIITNRRLIVLRADLWFNDDTLEFPLLPMRTVEASKRGFLQLLLNYGNLSFDIPDSTVRLIPNPHHKASVITNYLKEYGMQAAEIPSAKRSAT